MSSNTQTKELLGDLLAQAQHERGVSEDVIVKKAVRSKVADFTFKRSDGLYERWYVTMETGVDGVYINWQFALCVSEECPIPAEPDGYYCRLDDIDGLEVELLNRHDILGWYLVGDSLASLSTGYRLIVAAISGPVKVHLETVANRLQTTLRK